MIDHLEIETTSLHKDSQEAYDQLQEDGVAKDGQSEFFKYFFIVELYKLDIFSIV